MRTRAVHCSPVPQPARTPDTVSIIPPPGLQMASRAARRHRAGAARGRCAPPRGAQSCSPARLPAQPAGPPARISIALGFSTASVGGAGSRPCRRHRIASFLTLPDNAARSGIVGRPQKATPHQETRAARTAERTAGLPAVGTRPGTPAARDRGRAVRAGSGVWGRCGAHRTSCRPGRAAERRGAWHGPGRPQSSKPTSTPCTAWRSPPAHVTAERVHKVQRPRRCRASGACLAPPHPASA